LSELIIVPDVLPNNLRVIRDMRGLTVKQVAEDLKIDRNFLSAVEVENKNFSGKSTIRAMKYYDITFNQMYDVKDKRVLDYSYNKEQLIALKCEIKFDIADEISVYNSEEELLNNIEFNDKQINDELGRYIKNKYNKKGHIESYYIHNKYINENYIILEADVEYIEITDEIITEKREFDVNFVDNENKELARMIKYKGFAPTIDKEEVKIDGLNAKIDNDTIIFNKTFKFANSNDLKDGFEESSEIGIDDKRITLEKKRNKIVSVSFRVVDKEINNLKAIRTLINASIEDMHDALGLSYNGYINLELGNQKISSKIMWRLVNMLRIPLELIINVDKYYEKYCQHDKKIRKPRNE